jgi:hypothetical protein
MTDLDLVDGVLAGIVAWYSVTHRATARRLRGVGPRAAPGGELLVAFQAGDEQVRLDHADRHAVSLVVHRRWPTRSPNC